MNFYLILFYVFSGLVEFLPTLVELIALGIRESFWIGWRWGKLKSQLFKAGNLLFHVLIFQLISLSLFTIVARCVCLSARCDVQSFRVAPEIYAAFEWSHLAKSTKKLLLMPMIRSQKFSELRGVFFTVDLSLYLWVIVCSFC